LKSHRRRSLNLEVMLDVRIVDVRDLVRAGRDGRGHAHECELIVGWRGHGDGRNSGGGGGGGGGFRINRDFAHHERSVRLAHVFPLRRKYSIYVPRKSYCDCLRTFRAYRSGLKPHRRRSLNLEVMLDVRIVDVRDLVRAGRDGRGHAHERERITGGRGHGDSRNGGDLSQHLPIIARIAGLRGRQHG